MAVFTCHACKKELQAPVMHVLEKMIFAHMVAHEVVEMMDSERPFRSVPSDARLPTGGPAPKNQEGEGMTNG